MVLQYFICKDSQSQDSQYLMNDFEQFVEAPICLGFY